MKEQSLKKFTFYRLRFWLGYISIGCAFIAILTFSVLYVPGGINPAEKASVLKSASLSLQEPTSFLVTDAPYHALQKASITTFGLSSLSIKLPSAIIGFITGLGFVLLMRRWFTPSVSVIVGGIAVASTVFIFLAQQGTPAIMWLFWPVTIMLLASWAVSGKKIAPLAIVGLGVAAGLSLYTPLTIYILLALLIGGLLHPHVRYVVRRKVSKSLISLAIAMGILLIIPMAYMLYRTPGTIAAVFIGAQEMSFDLLNNLQLIGRQFFDVTGASNALTPLPAPFFILPTLLLALYGAVRLFRARHTAQNYILSSWLILLLPVLLLNPKNPELLFVPMILLVGVGVTHLLTYWYRLFPANPYARGFGLMLLVILLGGVMLTCMLRYYNTFHYSPPKQTYASQDLALVSQHLSALKPENTMLVVSKNELPLYQLYVSTNNIAVSVSSNDNSVATAKDKNVIMTRQAYTTAVRKTPSYVVGTAERSMASDRLYIYKNNIK